MADALSRRDNEENLTISISTPRWMEIVTEGYLNDPHTKQLLASLSVTPEGIDGYQLVNGVNRFKGRIWLGHHPEAQ